MFVKSLFFPQVGEIAYLMQQAVITLETLETFQIAKVCSLDNKAEFYVDYISLKGHPNYHISSLSINLFTGGQRI